MINKEKIGLLLVAILGGTLIVWLVAWSTQALTGELVEQTTDYFLPREVGAERNQIYQAALGDSTLRAAALAIIGHKERNIALIDSVSNVFYNATEEDLEKEIPEKDYSKAIFNQVFLNTNYQGEISFFDTIKSAAFYENHRTLKDLLPVFAKAKIDIEAAELTQLKNLIQQKKRAAQ